MKAYSRNRLFHAAGITLIYVLAGCAADSTTLNSERIARKFGNYSIEILENKENIRVSNLYSEAPAGRICRTFAVVNLSRKTDPSFASEHAQIIQGGSIGAVFKSREWFIEKEHLYIGEIAIESTFTRIVRLMHLYPPLHASIHVYKLRIWKDELSFDYATIAELHHPDYLTVSMLRRIYGKTFSETENRRKVADVIEIVRLKLVDPMFGAIAEWDYTPVPTRPQ